MWLPYMTRYACTAAYGTGDYDMCAEDNGDYVRWDELPDFAAQVHAAAIEAAAKLSDQMEADERVGQAIRALASPFRAGDAVLLLHGEGFTDTSPAPEGFNTFGPVRLKPAVYWRHGLIDSRPA